MKFQHLTIAACILLATASCNSGTSTTTADSTMSNMPATDTSSVMNDSSKTMHDTGAMAMSGDTSMHNHMQMCVVMEKNKMMVMDGGKTTPMKDIITMDNGTKVKPDGSYTTADGKTNKLKNGECIMKDGSMTTEAKMKM